MPLDEILPDDKPIRFSTVSGQSVESQDPTFKSVIRFIAEASPKTLTVEEVIAGVPRGTVQWTETQWRDSILMRLFEAFSGGIVRLVKDPPIGDYDVIEERPKASIAARAEAGFGSVVTVKGHHGSTMDFAHLKVLTLMDGTRTRGDLAQALLECHRRGEFKSADGTSGLADSLIQAKVVALVDKILTDIRSVGLLRIR